MSNLAAKYCMIEMNGIIKMPIKTSRSSASARAIRTPLHGHVAWTRGMILRSYSGRVEAEAAQVETRDSKSDAQRNREEEGPARTVVLDLLDDHLLTLVALPRALSRLLALFLRLHLQRSSARRGAAIERSYQSVSHAAISNSAR